MSLSFKFRSLIYGAESQENHSAFRGDIEMLKGTLEYIRNLGVLKTGGGQRILRDYRKKGKMSSS
jgi:hypothetical protein